MSSNNSNITDGINMHDPAVYYFRDHGDCIETVLMLIGNIMSHLEVFKFAILLFIPGQKHEEKPLLKRSNINELSYQALQDGCKSFGSTNHEDDEKKSSWNDIVDKTKQAFMCHKRNRQQNFLILVCSNGHGGLKVKYQFLEAGDTANVAMVCKQPLIVDDKAVCFIDIGTQQVKTCHA